MAKFGLINQNINTINVDIKNNPTIKQIYNEFQTNDSNSIDLFVKIPYDSAENINNIIGKFKSNEFLFLQSNFIEIQLATFQKSSSIKVAIGSSMQEIMRENGYDSNIYKCLLRGKKIDPDIILTKSFDQKRFFLINNTSANNNTTSTDKNITQTQIDDSSEFEIILKVSNNAHSTVKVFPGMTLEDIDSYILSKFGNKYYLTKFYWNGQELTDYKRDLVSIGIRRNDTITVTPIDIGEQIPDILQTHPSNTVIAGLISIIYESNGKYVINRPWIMFFKYKLEFCQCDFNDVRKQAYEDQIISQQEYLKYPKELVIKINALEIEDLAGIDYKSDDLADLVNIDEQIKNIAQSKFA